MASPCSSIVARRLLLLSSPRYSSGSSYPVLNPNTESSSKSDLGVNTAAILLLVFMAAFLILYIYFYLHRFHTLLHTPNPIPTREVHRFHTLLRTPNPFPTRAVPTMTATTMHYTLPPPQALDNILLESLPKVIFRSSPLFFTRNQQKQIESCVICLDEFSNEETLLRLPCCAHLFHPQCIKTWFTTHTTCPLCRQSLATPPHPLPNHPFALPIPIMGLVPSVEPSNLQRELCRMESRWHSMDHPQLLMCRARDNHHSSPLFISNSICDIPSSSSSSVGYEKNRPHMKNILGKSFLSSSYLKRSTSVKLIMTRRYGDGEGVSSASIKKRALTKFASDKYGSSWSWRSEQE